MRKIWQLRKLAGMTSTSSIPENFPEDWNEARENGERKMEAKVPLCPKETRHSTGWEGACHQWFLEVLGYRRNRAPWPKTLRLFPAKVWMEGLNIDHVYSSQNDWKLRGSRPANHPRKRLQQYAQVMKNRPNWMENLKSMNFLSNSQATTENLTSSRKKLGLKIREKNLGRKF